MQRFSTFRDFDWPLLSLIGLLSLASVLEIKSATLHTKFHGFDHKQILFLLAGTVLMFAVSLIDYHRLIDHRSLGVRHLARRARRGQDRRPEGPRRPPLD